MEGMQEGRIPARRISLPWRIFGALATLAALVIVNVLVTMAGDARLADQRQLQSDLRQAEGTADDLVGNVVIQQSELRGFALTGEQSLLDRYTQAKEEERQLFASLRRDLEREDELIALVDEIEDATRAWNRQVAEPVIARMRDDRQRAAERIVTGEGASLLDFAQNDTLRLSDRFDARLDAIQRELSRPRDRLDDQLLVSTGLSMILLTVSWLLLRRWITRPVAVLTGQVRRVADGQLSERIEMTGPAEFVDLGRDVELMRRRIMDELRATRRAMEALEQQAPLVTTLRSQLNADSSAELPEGLRIASRLEPAEGVLAGDWYDVIALDEERAVIIVVDVSGHGADAGLRALWVKHLLVPALQMGLDPGEALSWVAGQIGDTGEWFATCVIAEIESTTGQCRYANAGHPPALMVGSGGVTELEVTGPLFGCFPGQRWRTEESSLGLEQMLVIYTDGIVEPRNRDGDEFGVQRLVSCFSSAEGLNAREVADRVMTRVHEFGPDQLADDATLVVVTRVPPTSRPSAPASARERHTPVAG
jgi:CHASE3 domain sensor protein